MEKIIWQPAFVTALGMSALTLTFFGVTGGSQMQSVWFVHGELLRTAFLQGEWWRLFTAATLHADLIHVSSNAFFFLLLGWAAGEHFGAGMMLGVCLLTSLFGFAVSLMFSDFYSSVGISGGLFGLLGASGAHAWKHAANDLESTRLSRLRSYGAAILLLAMTAFSPQANLLAHLAGFALGVLIGLAAPLASLRNSIQLSAAMGTALMIIGAWLIALHHG